MKELVNGFAQLAAIIMILITLAVSTAAISQWASSEVAEGDTNTTQSQTMMVSGR